MTNKKLIINSLSVIVFLVLIFATIRLYANNSQSYDMTLYQNIADKTLKGFVPYQKDFFFEYPPMVAYFFAGIGLVKYSFFLVNYQTAFALSALLMTYIMLLLLNKLIKKEKIEILGLTIFSFIVSANVTLERYDIIPTFLAFASLYIIIKNYKNKFSYLVAGALIASGIFVKLFPVFVVLPVLVYFLVNKLFTKMFYYIAGMVIVTLPNLFLILQGLQKAQDFYNYHSSRGLEITSFGSTIARILNFFGIGTLNKKTICCPYGSIDLEYSYTNEIKTFLNVLLITGILLLTYSLYQNFKNKKFEVDQLIVYTTLFFSLFTITNKVFSIQYIVWIIPFIFLSIYQFKDKITKYILVLLSLYVIVINSFVFLYMWGDMKDLALFPVILTDTKNIVFWVLLIWMFYLNHKKSQETRNLLDSDN